MQQQQQTSPSLTWPQTPPTMPALTDAQVKQYLRDGFIVIPGLVSPAELEELKRDFVAIAKGKYQPSNIQPLPETMPEAEVLKNVLAIHMPHYISPTIRRYLAHPRITPILGQLTGAHMGEWWDGGVKACQSQLFVKPPGFQGQAWHQDEQYIPTRDRSLTAIWVAIDPVSAVNGGLRVLPGSHRRGILFPQRERTDNDEYDFSKEAYGFEEMAVKDGWGQEVAVEMNPGDVLYFNGYLLHRSTKNRSDIYRRVLTNHYMSQTTLLPWDAVDKARKQSAALADTRRVVPITGPPDPLNRPYEADLQFCYMRTCPANTDPEVHENLSKVGGFPKSYADKKSVDERGKL